MSWRKNLPNYLTYLRIAVIPALILVFFLKGEWSYDLSAGLFLLAGVTDWLDGYAARAFQAHSNIGRFLDPIADKLLVATALMLLVGDGRADYADGHAMMIPAIAIVCREILVSGLREFLAEIRVGVPVSRLAKWKTGVQMTAIFLLLWAHGGPDWLHAGILGNVLLWLAAILTLVTGYAYLKTGLKHMAQ
ncbi:MAG: CDP-diacylglycerol--glycerol-3-phosphate 3-phosphatidyltransferase [Pseudomonadota bacterium]|nr:CDP-diacylglycerol--glycerol-3-phosphate 3-phosphatidyltransferase [Pseudomonadota bacterium]